MSNGASDHANGKAATPDYVMDEVKLLIGDVSTPESAVNFDPTPKTSPADPRATPGSIRDSINPPWSWPNLAARNAQPVSDDDLGRLGYQSDTDTYYRLTRTTPKQWQQVPNPTSTSAPFELSTGASDADSYHDFFRLQIAFDDVWTELVDSRVERNGQQLYAAWNALSDPSREDTGELDRATTFGTAGVGDIAGADELQTFLDNLKRVLGLSTDSGRPSGFPTEITQLKDVVNKTLIGCNMLLQTINWAGRGGWGSEDIFRTQTAATNVGGSGDPYGNDLTAINGVYPGVARQDVFNRIMTDLQGVAASRPSVTNPGHTSEVTFGDVAELVTQLDGMLKEAYQFDVFAPASINYGLLLNYRQHWKPQSYQVGNLVSTIPLAPQETRRYTTKSVVTRSRSTKEIEESLRSGKDESTNTWRIDKEIVDRAKNQTNFQTNASGSYGNDNAYKVSAGMQQGQDQAVESAQTKRDFRESVVKSAQEYRSTHRLEITTDESREDETTSYREIRNPNDELTVTYLFYELQRRYLVDERLHKVTPVILVANEVPAPHEVDEAWLVRHDWILKRAILDDSFLPALEHRAANYTGEAVTLQVLELAVEQQKAVVDKIAQQVQLAQRVLDSATLGVESAEDQQLAGMRSAEEQAFVKSFFDPLGISKAGSGGDGNTDKARLDFAKDALDRAQAKVNQLTSDLKAETTALQVASDKHTNAATKHFGMLAEIDRLRVHVKDNIIHYMQAIWSYEPPDQRYFRLYNLDVPVFGHNTTVKTAKADGVEHIDSSHIPLAVRFPAPTLHAEPTKLHQVADIENLIGFKGNYMIFPMTNFNYMTWFMMQDYIHIDTTTGVTAVDPDPQADVSLDQLKAALAAIRANNFESFAKNQDLFQEIVLRLLTKEKPEMVIVPSNSLYIEALPGTHPLLEDFKLIHRAVDVKKAQAEARHAELENLRLSARLANAEYADPDIEKMIVVD